MKGSVPEIACKRTLWHNNARIPCRYVLGRSAYDLPLVRMTELGPEESNR